MNARGKLAETLIFEQVKQPHRHRHHGGGVKVSPMSSARPELMRYFGHCGCSLTSSNSPSRRVLSGDRGRAPSAQDVNTVKLEYL